MRVRLLLSAAILTATGGAFLACHDSSTGPASTTYVAALSAANETPAVASPATGTATYTLTGNTLTYTVTVTGLTSKTTMSHIHVGASGVAGPIVVPYTVYAVQNGLVTTGSIDLTNPVASGANTISGDSLKILLNNGNAYTNVHTSSFPAGEIRGQIIKQ